jgi:AcrR family transcriptional regulator
MPTQPRTQNRRPSKRTPRRLGRPPGKLGEDTRRVILLAARETFGRLGFERATNVDIAAAANVTAAAMYKHFESKADLYAAAVHDALGELIPKLRELVAKQPSVRSAFRALVSVLDSFDEQQRATARFLSSIPSEMQRHPQVAERMLSNPGEVYTIVTELVEMGVRKGEISPEKAPRMVSVMIATFMGLSAYSNTLGPSFTRHAVAGLIDLLDGELFAPMK